MGKMFDYARMMGLQDLGPAPLEYGNDDYSAALDMREEGPSHLQQPWMHQDYSGANPYEEGAHGSWLDDSMIGMMDGMGMLDQPGGGMGPGEQIPMEEGAGDEMEGGEDLFLAPHEGDMEAETEGMLGEELELDEDSADFQGLGDEDDEEY